MGPGDGAKMEGGFGNLPIRHDKPWEKFWQERSAVVTGEGRVPDEDDEFQVEYLSREEALAAARERATRDLVESESVISYVAFVAGLEDFCRCEFRFEPPHGWVQSGRMLGPAERTPDERITDDRIRAAARTGNVISAIRLYRGLHGVGLAEGKAGVERLLREGP